MPHAEELFAQLQAGERPSVYESTGVLQGGALSINSGDNTKFDMAAGLFAFVDYSAPATPERFVLVRAASVAQTVTNLATQLVTYVGVDRTGAIIQSSAPFTNAERRTIAQIGVLVHTNLTNLNAINDTAAPVREGISQLFDFMTAVGALNVTGNEVGANGANLSINKSAGQLFKLGATFQATPDNPHQITTAALVAPSNMRYRLSDSTEFANTAVLDPTQYESSPGVLSLLSNPNKFSVQRVNLFTSNLIRIQYGQAEYDTMADAGSAIAQNHFTTEANIAENGVLIGFVIMRRSTTDLTNTADAKFIAVGKFGVQGGSVSALSSTDQLPEGVVNLYFTDARAQAAVVTASIANGDTTHSPSGDAVFDALALKQPLDATLTGLAALSPTADQGIYATGADAFSTYSLTAGGRALGGVAGTANTFPYFSASNVVTLASITAAGLALLDDANAAAQRTTLGLGSGDTPTFTGVTTTGLATLAQAINLGALQATKAITTAVTPQWQMDGSGSAVSAAPNSSLGLFRWSSDAAAPGLYLSKSRGATQGTHTVTQTSDVLGRIGFMGSDGAAFFEAARIEALVSSSPATGSVPGMLVLSTTAIAGASATAALTLNGDQSALFGAYVTIPTTLVVGNTGAIPANTRALIDRIGTGTLPTLPGGTALTLQGNNAASNNNYLVNIAGAAGSAGIRFGDSASANQGRIDYDNATDSFSFFTNNASAMTISSAAAVTMAGPLTINGGASVVGFTLTGTGFTAAVLTGPAGTVRSYVMQTSAVNRWAFQADATAEGGANSGSDFRINRYSDAGSILGVPVNINRATGLVTLGATAVGADLSVTGNTTLTGDLQGSTATFSGTVGVGGLSGANIYNTYTPTLTAITNVSASAANVSGWIRIGNAVLVFAQISVTATAAAALTVIDISLPVASNFGAATQAVGAGSILTAGTEVAGVAISANATNDRARATFVSTSNAARTYTVMFGYIVI